MEGEMSKKSNTGNGKKLLKAHEGEKRWTREKKLKIQGSKKEISQIWVMGRKEWLKSML